MRVRDAFGDSVRPLDEIAFSTSLLLVNAHFSINQAKPIVPGLIEVGGLHIEKSKSLPKVTTKKKIVLKVLFIHFIYFFL